MGNNTSANNTGILAVIIILLLAIMGEIYYFANNKVSNNVSNVLESTDKKNTSNKKIPEITIITDKRCGAECDTKGVTMKLKEIPDLTNVEIKTLDYSDKKAKEIMDKNNIEKLPVAIFSNNSISELSNYLLKTKNNQYLLNIGGNFDPIAYEKLLARKETPKTLDVFTMGYCPFGEIALKALPEIKKTFKDDDIKINVHYIATKTGKGNSAKDFDSLHGTPEAEEDIRQICINKNYGVDKLIEYSTERYKNADNYGRITDNPDDAMKAVKIDPKKINTCVNSGEGGKLLEEDIKIAQELGIGASPTWFANNKFKFGGIKAENIQTQFCSHNSNLKGCKNKIESKNNDDKGTPTCGN